MSKCVLPGYETAKPEEQAEALRKVFKRVFTTEDGRIVLNAILNDLYYFDKVRTEAESALNNYAKFLVGERLGAGKTLSITDSILNNLD